MVSNVYVKMYWPSFFEHLDWRREKIKIKIVEKKILVFFNVMIQYRNLLLKKLDLKEKLETRIFFPSGCGEGGLGSLESRVGGCVIQLVKECWLYRVV